ncbi:MbcA/ParS/Xre antitoxin family protein [Paraburkholderia sp. IMGN_8]
MHTPAPALGSRPPIELLGTPEGVALVSSTIARMQSGAYM